MSKVYSIKSRQRFYNSALDFIRSSKSLDLRTYEFRPNFELFKVVFVIRGELDDTLFANFKGLFRWRVSALFSQLTVTLYF